MLQFLKMQTLPRRISIIIYLFLSFLILLLDKKGILDIFHRASQTLTIPATTRLYKLKNYLILPINNLTTKIDKDKKIQELETQNSDLIGQVARLQSIEAENLQLRRLLGSNLPPSWRFEPARVISYSSDTLSVLSSYTPEKPLVAIVTAENKGILVGLYQETLGKEIKIASTSNSETKIQAVVKNSSGVKVATGLVRGEGGKIVLDQVLSGEKINEGDNIFTSGEGLPPDLLIGNVSKVIKLEGQALQKAEIAPAVNFDNLTYVFFVTKY